MVDVIEKARKRLAELEREAERLRMFLNIYQALESSDDITLGDSVDAEIKQKGAPPSPSRQPDKPKRIVKFAKSALREAGRPMTRTELVKELENRGLVIGGSDKSKNMGTILWRSEQFDNVEGEGYWPKDAPPWNAALKGLGL